MSKKNKENDADKSCLSVPLSWYPGHMAKTKKQILEDLKLVDVVIEILDARIPIASKNPNLQEWIKNKKKIIVLNKCDLAEESKNKEWLEYYKKRNIPAVLVNANSGEGIKQTIKKIQEVANEDRKSFEAKGRVGKSVRIMIVGIPNVGKSSFINRIANKASTVVGDKPGVTKQKQWVRLKEKIELLDTPGILWPKLEPKQTALNLAYTGSIKEDNLEKQEIAFFLLKYLLEEKRQNLINRYAISNEEIEEILNNKENLENENIVEIMYKIGKKRGAIKSNGIVDEEKCANILLEDFRIRKIRKNYFGKTRRGVNVKKMKEIIPRNRTKEEVKLMPPLVWAYIGDCVYELYIRMNLVNSTKLNPHKLHIEAIKYVKASAQAEILNKIYEKLTEEEKEIVKRGRNAKNHHLPKNANVIEYKYSTAFEGLIGYLYLTKQDDRLMEILQKVIE